MNEVAKKEAPTVPAESNAVLSMIERVATDPNADVDKLERMLAMQERILDREAKSAYDNAMADAQAEMRPVSQDASNQQTRSKYATYGALDKAIRPVYTSHGFAIEFDSEPSQNENEVIVVAEISHRAGHTRVRRLPMPCDGKGAKGNDVMTKTHAMMSAMSYGKRGLLKMVFNIAEGEDDDGNAASGKGSATISDETKEDIIALIKATSSNTAKALTAVYGANGPKSLDDLTTRDPWPYGKLVNALREKKRRLEAQANA